MTENFTTYQQTIDWLFGRLAVFQRDGGDAYKPGLDTSRALASSFGNPQDSYPTIHIAGTNGKGSTAHTIAAILQSSGYKVGLYTSPHLVDFRERMRVNGEPITEAEVVDFVNRFIALDSSLRPSFFELTMVMAFEFFANRKVDVAVIETGLGGRLDSTNIIKPILSIITNISFDHTQFLGDTLEKIASEKAGIIKTGIPVVIGEATGGVRDVFEDTAKKQNAQMVFAEDTHEIDLVDSISAGTNRYFTRTFGTIDGELSGEWQAKNAATILEAVKMLRKSGFNIPDTAVREGFGKVCSLTGLAGRWMSVGDNPVTICDTGHNTGGWEYLSRRIASLPGVKHLVIGFVNDKDVSGILKMMKSIPSTRFYFAKSSVARALDSEQLLALAKKNGLSGNAYPSVALAYEAAKKDASERDSIFVGGSTFVVADFLSDMK
ncbi:MAG: bifunctional folylpolyglutamate synthase/dihydrofolate synthase [Paramuribaculum sp.]|nr:bifunctional folylpolyglutamate synthase/dihydrofolate synthase [Paramuribaculum sp.]